MSTVTIEVEKHSSEWILLKSFIHSSGLSMRELNPTVAVRTGWAEAAKKMYECKEDQLLIDNVI